MKKLFSLAMAVVAVAMVNAATYTLTMSQYAATEFTEGNFSLTCNKAGAQNEPAYNGTSNDVRVYANGQVVITCPDGLSQLVFHTSSKGREQQSTITPSTGSISQTKGGEIITWTGSATTLTLSVGGSNDYGTSTKTAGQFDFTSIDVTTNGTGSTGGGTTGGGTGRTITINGLQYADVLFYSLFDENDMIYMELYAEDDDVDYYPFVGLEMGAKSATALAGTYDLYWAGYWPTANDSVESDWDDMDPVGSLTITYANGVYTLSASWTGLDGNTYQFTCSPDLMAFDEDYEEITLNENGGTTGGNGGNGGSTGTAVTVDQAIAIGNGLADNASTSATYSVVGYVAKLAGNYNTQYGSQSFYMNDTPTDGTGYYDFEAYQCTLAAPGVQVGDRVRVTGQILKYVSKNGSTTIEIKQGTVEILGIAAVEHIEGSQKAEKVIRNGHIMIRRGDAIYSVTGKRGE